MADSKETSGERKITASDVAQWMLQEVQDGALYQETAVYEIRDRFGKEFVYTNDNGNLAISRKVLKEFRKLTEKKVDWSRSEKGWFLRDPGDTSEGRSMD